MAVEYCPDAHAAFAELLKAVAANLDAAGEVLALADRLGLDDADEAAQTIFRAASAAQGIVFAARRFHETLKLTTAAAEAAKAVKQN